MEGNTQRAEHMVWENLPHGQAEASPRSTACTEGTKGNSTCPRDTWLTAASFSLLLVAPGSLLSSCGPISGVQLPLKTGWAHTRDFIPHIPTLPSASLNPSSQIQLIISLA